MQNKNTANKEEVNKFNKLAKEWWDPNGKFAPIHKFNPVRQEYLINKISEHFSFDLSIEKPFKKIDILDVGCGGGLLCEPLSRLGANMTGIDAARTNIEVAKLHMIESDLKINYLNKKPEEIIDKKFDVILCMEIIEHVEDVDFFIDSCIKLLNKNGIIFFATLNKTLKSFVLAIIGAEYVLRWLPIGTHDWKKFISPNQIINKVSRHYLSYVETKGVVYNPLKKIWKLSNDIDVNYMCYFKKN
ncbi:MAG: bifunctional 3-demethylubiquinol 3-O-methyltransferase/2-polyprenyl-6-hydroxyphenol methylase [Candidatus Pelagibacter sp.]|nr:bifunctional 3-demethylubiquinol 3-O-methyltransferase/2-polyprenyl-6-hydroxyphenol methylase [Candidatus Pelagibacter sp.]OUV88542.1 MAG: bifunctional 3-demethylubiquinol 3-O-methyltransferase/2-polyprenyl-6-hydroxyphenol methylase [Pelagibacteraceae bacterium TMED136]